MFSRAFIPKGWRRVRLGEVLPEEHKYYYDNSWKDNPKDGECCFTGKRLARENNETPHIIRK